MRFFVHEVGHFLGRATHTGKKLNEEGKEVSDPNEDVNELGITSEKVNNIMLNSNDIQKIAIDEGTKTGTTKKGKL